jgi:hypothetical protein
MNNGDNSCNNTGYYKMKKLTDLRNIDVGFNKNNNNNNNNNNKGIKIFRSSDSESGTGSTQPREYN